MGKAERQECKVDGGKKMNCARKKRQIRNVDLIKRFHVFVQRNDKKQSLDMRGRSSSFLVLLMALIFGQEV